MSDDKISPFSGLTQELWQDTVIQALAPTQAIADNWHHDFIKWQKHRLDFIAEHGQEAWDALPENVAIRERNAAMTALTNLTEAITEAGIECIKRWPEARTDSVFQWLIEVAEQFHDHECDY